MLVTDSFVFLHVPKTGGTFVQTILPEYLPVQDFRPYTHTPYNYLPERWQHLPVVCTIRNPWDWYVSWYHYDRQRPPRPGRASVFASDEQSVSFAEATARACKGDIDHELSPLLKREGIDLYSGYVESIAGEVLDRPDFTALRFEQLVADLMRFLKRRSLLSRELKRALREEPPIRTSQHGPFRDYYDDELAALVGDRARSICDRFGYRFGH
jgi:hypothetical protein